MRAIAVVWQIQVLFIYLLLPLRIPITAITSYASGRQCYKLFVVFWYCIQVGV